MKKIISFMFCLSLVGIMSTPSALAQTVKIQTVFPAGGEQFLIGSTQVLRWSAPSSVNNVNISINSYLSCMYTAPTCAIPTVMTNIATNVPNNGIYNWYITNNFAAGSYILNIEDVGGSGLVSRSNVFSLYASSIIPMPSYHAPGTNIVMNGVVYYIQPQALGTNNQPTLIPYASAQAFLSYGTNAWTKVEAANTGDAALVTGSMLMPFADGSLVNDNGTVYVISNGYRYGIVSPTVFLGLDYKWTNVINGNTSFMPSGQIISSVNGHMPGTLINQNGTIYYISQSGKVGIPSMNVFSSWGLNLKDVVTANGSDVALAMNSASPSIAAWASGNLNISK